MKTTSYHPQGYTLVELLLVVGIIAVLAALLFPLLSSTRESARQAVCVSNQRQLALALQMYAQDYGGYLPAASLPLTALNGVTQKLDTCPSSTLKLSVQYPVE